MRTRASKKSTPKSRYFAAVSSSSVIGTYMLLILTSIADELFIGIISINIDDLEQF